EGARRSWVRRSLAMRSGEPCPDVAEARSGFGGALLWFRPSRAQGPWKLGSRFVKPSSRLHGPQLWARRALRWVPPNLALSSAEPCSEFRRTLLWARRTSALGSRSLALGSRNPPQNDWKFIGGTERR